MNRRHANGQRLSSRALKTNCGRGGVDGPTLSRIISNVFHNAPTRTLAAVLIALSCKGGEREASTTVDSAKTGGTVVISTGGDPDVLMPPLVATIQGRQVSELVYDHLADLGNELNTAGDGGFKPHLAKSWTWSPDSLSIAFSLDPRARWHDGVPARASDVAFTYALYKDSATASPSAPLIAGIDSVTARDSVTAVFWFKKRSPMQFFEAVDPMVILPEHLLRGVKGKDLRTSALARSPVGTGQFRFRGWKAGASIQLAADTGNYRGGPKIDRVIWSIAPDFNTAFTRLLGGESDVLEQLAAPNVAQLVGNSQLRTALLPGMEYNFIQFNLRDPAKLTSPHPLFADRGLRRALTMAVDRAHTVQNVYDTLAAVAVGPTVRAYASTDTTLQQIPYSSEGARHLLDSLGWRISGGQRESAQRPPPGIHGQRSELEQKPDEHGGAGPESAAAGGRNHGHRPPRLSRIRGS